MEIERKFFIEEMPDLSKLTPVRYERYYMRCGDGIEERVQKKGGVYEYEFKREVSVLERTKEKRVISELEFNTLRAKSGKAIIRDSYMLSSGISIKVYHGDYEGLVRAEIEFDSTDDAIHYKPEPWMGREITQSKLGRDSALLSMNDKEFKKVLSEEINQ